MSLSHLSDPSCLSPCQGRYFLVRDVVEKMDVLGTVQSCGAPNFRQVRGGLTVFGMGQPTLSGFRRVLQKLQEDGHRVSMTASQAGSSPQVWQRDSFATSEVLEGPGHLMVAGDPDQALPGLECHDDHRGQHGWEILGEYLLPSNVWTREP